MDNNWNESTLANGFMTALAIRGTTWNQAIDNDPDLDFFPFSYDETGKFRCSEISIESPEVYAFENPERYACYPHNRPSSYNFDEWISKYWGFAIDDEEFQNVLNIPMQVKETDGFCIFAVGYPFGNMGLPSVEVFFTGSTGIEHLTWEPDDPAEWILQEEIFVFKLIKELKIQGKLPSGIDENALFPDAWRHG